MFRESIGNYKLNIYLNRKEFRSLEKAMRSKKPSELQKLQLAWIDAKTKETNV